MKKSPKNRIAALIIFVILILVSLVVWLYIDGRIYKQSDNSLPEEIMTDDQLNEEVPTISDIDDLNDMKATLDDMDIDGDGSVDIEEQINF